METLAAYDDERLARDFGELTLRRAREYAATDRVTDLVVNEVPSLVLLQAKVRGTGGRSYSTSVTLVDDEHEDYLTSRCSCPVAVLCKHGAAVVLHARDRSEVAGPARSWERRLARVLDELEDSADAAAVPRRTLALQVELTEGRSSTRYAWDTSRTGRTGSRGFLRLRPLQRGARDNWVKTNASWVDVPSMSPHQGYDPDQVALLNEILTGFRAANRQSYYGADQHLSLGGFGPALWSQLQQAQALGVALVPAGLLAEVTVAEEPVSLQLDVGTGPAPEGSHGSGNGRRAQVQVGVGHGEEFFVGDRLEVLGATGHGAALWTADRRRWSVVLAPFAKPVGARTRRLLAEVETLTVPDEDVPDLVADYLPRLQRHLPVVSSDGSVAVPEAAEPRLALTVTWKAVDEVHIAWRWRYRVGEDDRAYGLDESRGLRGVRRRDAEAALLAALDLSEEQVHRLCRHQRREEGLAPEQTFSGWAAVAFAEDALVPLEESGQVEIEEVGARPDYQEATEVPVVRFHHREVEDDPEDGGPADRRTDWLDLEVIITIGDHAISLPALLEALTLGTERIVLPTGVHLRVDRPEFAQLAELVKVARDLEETEGDTVRVHKGDLGLWDELAELGIVDAQAAQWVQAAQALRSLKRLPDAEPVGIEAELRSYQVDGFRWLVLLWQCRLGGILADDMGLGKTLQTLALIAHARSRADGGPFLVVAPTSVVSTWAQEAATFAPGLVVRTVTESRSRRRTALAEVHEGADVVITSYTLYRLEVEDYTALAWGGLVLDEAQTVKNHTSKTYQAVRRLDVPFRLALSGTPMENRLMELWSLLSIVAPGLYPYPQQFRETVAGPVEKEGDRAVLERFRRRISPFLLRRTKDLVAADLPPKQEQVLEVTLTPRHRRVYDTHLHRERQRVLGLLGDFDRQRVAIFRSLTKLRQLSLDAALVDPDHDGIGSAKIDVLLDHLQEIVAEGHRALVFSQFTSFLTRVRARLDAAGIESRYLDGRTRRRADVVGGFKSGEAPVFLISLKAGGVGLTLTEADYVFVLDPWWNPAVEAQAVDRAHRIGQDRPVIVYRLVSVGTIEEKVMELKARKAELFASVLDAGDGPGNGLGSGTGAPLEAADIRELLSD